VTTRTDLNSLVSSSRDISIQGVAEIITQTNVGVGTIYCVCTVEDCKSWRLDTCCSAVSLTHD